MLASVALKSWTVVDDPEAAANAAAAAVVSGLRDALAGGGEAVLAVSAVTAVLLTLARLAAVWGDRVAGSRVRILLADEWAVAPADPASRYGALYRSFLKPAKIAPGHCVRFWSEGDPPEFVVSWFETSARDLFGVAANRAPRLDVALLGVEPPGTLGPFGRGLSPASDPGAFAGSVQDGGRRFYSLTPEFVAGAGCIVAVWPGPEDERVLEPARKALDASGAEAAWIVGREMTPL